MESVSLGRAAALGAVFGCAAGVAWMAALAARTITSITRQHHWHQLKKL